MKEILSQPIELVSEPDKKIGRRDFLKLAAYGGALGGIAATTIYLRSEVGKKLVTDLLEENFGVSPQLEVDSGSKKVIDNFNETIERSFGNFSKIEQSVAGEMVKRRDFVFFASEFRLVDIKIGLNEPGDGISGTSFDYNTRKMISKIDIHLPNVDTAPIEMIKHFSHELTHAYQFISNLYEFGYGSVEMEEFMNNKYYSEIEMDAWMFDILSSYMYTRTHPKDNDRGTWFDPPETGIDELGFAGFWLGRKQELPQKLVNNLEFRWFLERYELLVAAGFEIFQGEKNVPPLFTPTVRDSDVSEGFVTKASDYIVQNDWSETAGMVMDPTENNPLVLRHFIPTNQFHS